MLVARTDLMIGLLIAGDLSQVDLVEVIHCFSFSIKSSKLMLGKVPPALWWPYA